MKIVKHVIFLLTILASVLNAADQKSIWDWEAGPYTPGFRFMEMLDYSRFYPDNQEKGRNARPICVHIWYPAKKTIQTPMKLKDYIQANILPVQLSKGLECRELNELMERPTKAVKNASFAAEGFPVLIIGQGLYYESPVSHVVLCEFLASHGYIVATCPLLGTQYRLVNLNVTDLETEIRDLEFVIGTVKDRIQVKAGSLGVIGYDLGGMAGLILSMRNPSIKAFLSLDAGILFGHSSGLPHSHPDYQEKNFTIPWMHMTQARFIKTFRDEQGISTLIDRKSLGDSYLIHVPTDNHGEFTSYAMFGLQDALPGYWGSWAPGAAQRYHMICHNILAFFDAYLKKEFMFLEKLKTHQMQEGSLLKMEYKRGQQAPPSESELVHSIIQQGINEARPVIEEARNAHPDSTLISENVLNWLGYHFLYWWGREVEALGVFQLNVWLYPDSANAYDSLGEAHLVLGDIESAIKCYKKSLELNPKNTNAAEQLKRLIKQKK
jgi:hypothetical protein